MGLSQLFRTQLILKGCLLLLLLPGAAAAAEPETVKPAASISELRWDLESRVLEVLVSYVLKRITELKLSNQDLREQRHLVEMQIRLAQAERAGLAPLLDKKVHCVPITSAGRIFDCVAALSGLRSASVPSHDRCP